MNQWLGALVDPLAMVWLLLCCTAAWLACKRRWLNSALLAAPAALLFFFGSLPWPEALVARWEAPYAEQTTAKAPPADAVVMLGGIFEPSTHDAFGFALRAGSQRLVTAMEAVRKSKARAVVLGGSGSIPGRPGEPAVSLLCNWVRQWNVGCVDILNLGVCKSTHDEAVRLKQLKTERGWKQITLVTSALHMRRAEAAMRRLNGPVNIVACDFRVYGVDQEPWRYFPFPQIARLQLLHDYLHEVVGYWAYRWRGWI